MFTFKCQTQWCIISFIINQDEHWAVGAFSLSTAAYIDVVDNILMCLLGITVIQPRINDANYFIKYKQLKYSVYKKMLKYVKSKVSDLDW